MSATPTQFEALLVSLVAYFAAEPAAVSVNTEHFGTIARAEASALLAQFKADRSFKVKFSTNGGQRWELLAEDFATPADAAAAVSDLQMAGHFAETLVPVGGR